jgi:hypothetical protein
MRWTGNVAHIGEKLYMTLMVKPEGNMPLGRPRRRWDIIKMDLREIELGGTDWIHLAENKDKWRVLVNMAMNLQVS